MGHRQRRWGRPHSARSVALAASACALALFAAAACLPDLAALPPVTDEGGTVTPSGPVCGNGIIEAFDGGTETCDPGDAATPGCASCRVTCEGTLDPSTQHCYFAAGPRAGFAQANEACLAQGAHLVTMDGPDEAKLAGGVADGGTFWVGLVAEAALGAYGTRGAGVPEGYEPGAPEPAKGTGPCPGCFVRGRDGGGFDPLDDAGASTFACVVANGGTWLGASCDGVAPMPQTICEREPRGQRSESCGGALCFSLPKTNKSYVLLPGFTSGDDAQRSCEELSGRLVVLDSPDEREELVREILTVSPVIDRTELRGYWIGLSASDGGAFTWADGKTATERAIPWSDQEPRAASGRAYLAIVPLQYDTGLVSVETNPAVTYPAICER